MKSVFFMLLTLFAAGCASTTGEWVKGLDSLEPYRMSYSIDYETARRVVKELLYSNGWELSTDDQPYMITLERELPKDEYVVHDAFMGEFTGASVLRAYGKLLFKLSEGELVMTAEIVNQDRRKVDVSQGYPLMIKYRRLLEAQGFTLHK